MPDKDSCYQCPDRHFLCHADCEKHARREARRQAEKEERNKRREVDNFLIDSIHKEKKRVNKK